MDNLPAHKVTGTCEHIEAVGARLLNLPAYSLDFNPIELALPSSMHCCVARRRRPSEATNITVAG